MVVGVDVDGVLNDLHTPWLSLYNSMSGDSLTLEQVKSFDIGKYVKPGFEREIYNLLNTPGLFRNAPVLAGAKEGMQTLLDAGHDIVIVSAFYPNPVGCIEKTAWLEEHFPMLDLKRCLVFTKAKHLLKLDVLIDDCPDNLRELKDWTDDVDIHRVYGLLFSKPYNVNEDCTISERRRVDNWEDVIQTVARISQWEQSLHRAVECGRALIETCE